MSPFQRLIFEHSQAAALSAFILAAGVYLATAVRALRMAPARRDRLAALPLSDSPPASCDET